MHFTTNCSKRAQRGPKPNQSARINSIDAEEEETAERDESTEHVKFLFDRFTLNSIALNSVEDPQQQLIRNNGTIDKSRITVLFDSGASVNVIRPCLATHVLKEKMTQIELFDGSTTSKKKVRYVQATLTIGPCVFEDLVYLEWDMPRNQDVILGRPWHYKYQPIYDWQTEAITFPEDDLRQLQPTSFVCGVEEG
ncbi:hypothetical protein PINS_up013607 [Pythium insidiosum]|nr:hypothetical protein PINS_up013607 [Pythium insidiosum]